MDSASVNDNKASSKVPAPLSTVPETEARTAAANAGKTREIGGPKGLEPTRYGDWERGGKCVDF